MEGKTRHGKPQEIIEAIVLGHRREHPAYHKPLQNLQSLLHTQRGGGANTHIRDNFTEPYNTDLLEEPRH